MSSELQEELKMMFQTGYNLMWNPDEDTAKTVASMTKREDEAGLCANFADGSYVSLFECEVEDFVTFYRLKTDE